MSALIAEVGLGQIESILETGLLPRWALVAWRTGPSELPEGGARIALEIDGYGLCPLDVFRTLTMNGDIPLWVGLLPQESDPLIIPVPLSALWVVIRAHGIVPDTPDVPIFPCKGLAARTALKRDVAALKKAATP